MVELSEIQKRYHLEHLMKEGQRLEVFWKEPGQSVECPACRNTVMISGLDDPAVYSWVDCDKCGLSVKLSDLIMPENVDDLAEALAPPTPPSLPKGKKLPPNSEAARVPCDKCGVITKPLPCKKKRKKGQSKYRYWCDACGEYTKPPKAKRLKMTDTFVRDSAGGDLATAAVNEFTRHDFTVEELQAGKIQTEYNAKTDTYDVTFIPDGVDLEALEIEDITLKSDGEDDEKFDSKFTNDGKLRPRSGISADLAATKKKRQRSGTNNKGGGKFVMDDDGKDAMINFGTRFPGHKVSEIARDDRNDGPGYLRWMLGQDFPDYLKSAIRTQLVSKGKM